MRFLSPTLAALAFLPLTHLTAEDAPPPKADITQAELNELHRQLGQATAALHRRPSIETGTALGDLLPDHPPADNELIVIASRRDTSLLRTPVSAAVVDAEDIATAGYPAELRDRLRDIPGISFWQNGGPGGLTSISLRGANSYDTRLLLDGIPLGNPAAGQGQLDLALFPGAGTDRIEILKGAQSAVHGSRAVGGVVDLRTLRPTENLEMTGRVEAGSMRTGLTEVRASGPIAGHWGFACSVEALSSEGISKRTDQPGILTLPVWTAPSPWNTSYQNAWDFVATWHNLFRQQNGTWKQRFGPVPAGDDDGHEADAFRKLSGSARVEYAPNDRLRCYVAGYGLLASNEVDGYYPTTGTANPDDESSLEKTTFCRGSAGFAWTAADHITVLGDVAHGQFNQVFPYVTTWNMDRNYDTRESYASLRTRWEVLEAVTLTLGVDWHHEEADFIKGDGSGETADTIDYLLNGRWAWFPSAPWFEKAGLWPSNQANAVLYWQQSHPIMVDAMTTGVWGELGISLNAVEFSLSARNDVHSLQGDGATMRAAGAWLLKDGRVKFRGAVANGFRAPSLYELSSQWGNPALKAQTSVSYEAGVDLQPVDGVTLAATAFRTVYDRQIYFYSQWEPGAMPPNPAASVTGFRNLERDAWVQGWEGVLTVAPPASCWELVFGYTRLHSQMQREDGSNRPMVFIPEKTLAASAVVKAGPLRVQVGLRHVGEKADLTWNDVAVVIAPGYNHYFVNRLPASTVVGAALTWQVHPQVEIYARGENLLDENYMEVAGYSTVRPAVYVGVKGTL